MITRTFRAETMMQALEQVKKDLGDDALVVSARQIPGGQPWQVWRKPLVEVIAVQLEPGEESSAALKASGTEKPVPGAKKPVLNDLTKKDTLLPKKINTPPLSQESNPSAKAPVSRTEAAVAPALTTTEEKASIPAINTPSVDVVEIHGKKRTRQSAESKLDLLQQLSEDEKPEDLRIIQVSAKKPPVLPPLELPTLPWRPPQEESKGIEGAWPVLQKFYDQLIRQGVEAGMVKRVCQLSADTLGYQTAMDSKKLVEHLRRQLEAYVKVQREPAHNERQVICLVGPSGAGKTSFSAKLAVRYRKEMKRSVAWVCADTVRTGGIAEARAFTEAIGISMQVAYTPAECSAILNSLAGTDLVIVDTPACNPRSEESLIETAALLTAIPERITWIVVPATAKEADLVNTAGAFSIFKPRALVVTKMDETNSFGTVYNLGLRTQLPFAYFSCGAHGLDDLIPAAASRLVQALFTERFDQ